MTIDSIVCTKANLDGSAWRAVITVNGEKWTGEVLARSEDEAKQKAEELFIDAPWNFRKGGS